VSRISEPTALTNDRSSLKSPESDAHPLHKAHLLQAATGDTALTELSDVGWPASLHRVLRNSTYQRWSPSLSAGPRTR
jgi:NAD(P)H-dependent flavin oxidoreductase YrpB (nitropropane dioxygenase family)